MESVYPPYPTFRYWLNNATGAAGAVTGDIKTGIQPIDHLGWVKLDGRLKSTLSPQQQEAATALGFGTNIPDAAGLFLTQNGQALGSVTGDNARTLTRADLPNVTLGGIAQVSGGHNHTGSVGPGGAHTHSGATTPGGQHYHTYTVFSPGGGGGNDAGTDQSTGSTTKPTSTAPHHSHGLSIDSVTDHIHALSIDSVADHTHAVVTDSLNGNVTQTQLDIVPKSMSINMFVYLGL